MPKRKRALETDEGTPGVKPTGNPALLLRLPENVGAKLAKDAKKAKTTAQAVVLGILASHYGIEVAAPRRGKPKSVESE